MVESYLNTQSFSSLNIYISIAFAIMFAGLLFYKKKYLTILAGFSGSLFSVLFNYLIGNLALNAYTVSSGNLFLIILATNMCYSFVSVSVIWIILQKDIHTFEWCAFALTGWILSPVISNAFSNGDSPTVLTYDSNIMTGTLGMLLVVGLFILIVYNIRLKSKQGKINIIYLLALGVSVPLAHGIAFNLNENLLANIGIILLNSVLSMTFFMPILYIIFLSLTSKVTESLKKRKEPKTISARIEEFNSESIIEKRKYDKKSYTRPSSSVEKIDWFK